MIRIVAHLALVSMLGCASASVVSIAEVATPSELNHVEVEREETPASIRASSRSPSRDGRIPGLELLRLRFDANGPMPDRLLDFLGEERGTPDGLGLLQQRMDELEAKVQALMKENEKLKRENATLLCNGKLSPNLTFLHMEIQMN